MVIPEGDWFCPPCNHKSLVSSLGSKLEELDVLLKKTEAERRRKERLAFVNQSLAKALPTQSPSKKAVAAKPEISSSSDSSSDSEDEPLLQRRCRKEVKYNDTEYDDMIKKAIGPDIVKAPKVPKVPVVVSEESEEESEEEDDEEDSPGKPKSGQGKGKDMGNFPSDEEEDTEKPKPMKIKANNKMKKKKGGKKKKKKMTDLNASDDDDGDSGSDFKP